jgi:hypothetical protein
VVGEGRKQIERKASLSEGKIGLKLKNRSKEQWQRRRGSRGSGRGELLDEKP